MRKIAWKKKKKSKGLVENQTQNWLEMFFIENWKKAEFWAKCCDFLAKIGDILKIFLYKNWSFVENLSKTFGGGPDSIWHFKNCQKLGSKLVKNVKCYSDPPQMPAGRSSGVMKKQSIVIYQFRILFENVFKKHRV